MITKMTYFGKNRNGGLIKTAFVVIVAVVAIGYFVDIKSLVDSKWDSKRMKNNFQYLKTLSLSVWKGNISASVNKAWGKIFDKNKK